MNHNKISVYSLNKLNNIQFISPEAIFMELDGFSTFPHQDPLELSYLVLKSPPPFSYLPTPKSVISAQYQN